MLRTTPADHFMGTTQSADFWGENIGSEFIRVGPQTVYFHQPPRVTAVGGTLSVRTPGLGNRKHHELNCAHFCPLNTVERNFWVTIRL